MTKKEMIRRTRKAMAEERKLPAEVRFSRMVAAGIVTPTGEPAEHKEPTVDSARKIWWYNTVVGVSVLAILAPVLIVLAIPAIVVVGVWNMAELIVNAKK